MSNVLSMDVDGVSVTIDSEVFSGYISESNEMLAEIEALKQQYKGIVETVHETTKLDKSKVRKYLKARFNVATKAVKAEGELFKALDETLDN